MLEAWTCPIYVWILVAAQLKCWPATTSHIARCWADCQLFSQTLQYAHAQYDKDRNNQIQCIQFSSIKIHEQTLGEKPLFRGIHHSRYYKKTETFMISTKLISTNNNYSHQKKKKEKLPWNFFLCSLKTIFPLCSAVITDMSELAVISWDIDCDI